MSAMPDIPRIPFDPVSESCILANALMFPELVPLILSELTAEDFTYSYRVIFRAIRRLSDAGHPISTLSLCNELKRQDELEVIGGAAAIHDLWEAGGMKSLLEPLWIPKLKAQTALRQLLAIEPPDIDTETDPGQVIHEASVKLEKIHRRTIPNRPPEMKEAVTEAMDYLRELAKHPGELPGLSTGFEGLDDLIGGLQAGQMIILGARPAMGKTQLALNIALYLTAAKDRHVAFLSLEMSRRALTVRMLAHYAQASSKALLRGHLDMHHEKQLEAIQHTISQKQLTIVSGIDRTLPAIEAEIRKMAGSKYPPNLIILDHLQLIEATREGIHHSEVVEAASKRLKALALALSVPILVLSQLNRDPAKRGSDHRPQLVDLRDSGSIEADADVVLFLHRESYYKPDEDEHQGKAEIIVSKNREGENGTVHLFFNPHFGSFYGEERDYKLQKTNLPPATQPVIDCTPPEPVAPPPAPIIETPQQEEDPLLIYELHEEDGVKVYKNGPTTLKVWAVKTCKQRLQAMLDQSQDTTAYFNKLAAWLLEQPTRMHSDWANDCYNAMSRAFDELSNPAPAPPAAMNLFEQVTP